MGEVKIRNKERRMVRAGDLLANPKNWREHPKKQRDAMQTILDEIGFAGGLLAYENEDGELVLIDGHLRRDMNPDAVLPVDVTDLSEEEADQLLAGYDPIAAMAKANAEAHKRLLESMAASSDRMKSLAKGLGYTPPETIEPAPQQDFGELTRWDVPDALWPTDNDYEVPLLDATLQADALDLPVTVWGATSRNARMRGTWAFYTDDYRFKALWDDPSPVVNTQCVNVIEPNFSTNSQMPFAVGLYRIYQKRWLARWWQSHGVRVFVDMHVNPKFRERALLGVPAGWKAYATRGYDKDADWLDAEYALAVEHAGDESGLLFVVYGGGKVTRHKCRQNGWAHIDERMNRKYGT